MFEYQRSEGNCRTVMIPIPKKARALKYSDGQTISWILHAVKKILRVLNRRLIEYVDEEQFVLSKEKGTTDAFGMLVLKGERYIERKGFSLVELQKQLENCI